MIAETFFSRPYLHHNCGLSAIFVACETILQIFDRKFYPKVAEKAKKSCFLYVVEREKSLEWKLSCRLHIKSDRKKNCNGN